jgi:hypothetical protein
MSAVKCKAQHRLSVAIPARLRHKFPINIKCLHDNQPRFARGSAHRRERGETVVVAAHPTAP